MSCSQIYALDCISTLYNHTRPAIFDLIVTKRISKAMNLINSTTPILNIPLSHHRFDFPSFYRINGEVTIEMLPFRKMAQITLGNWQCSRASYKCMNPLQGHIWGNHTNPNTWSRRRHTSSSRG